MLFDEALWVLWMQWMFCRESLTTKDISAESADVIDLVITVLQENVSSLIYVLLRENMHFSTILRFNDFHMEQFGHVCWLNKPESFFARALHTCHSAVWQNGRVPQKNQKVEGALWGREYFPWLLQYRDDCTVCWGPKQKFTGSPHIGPINKVTSAKSGEMQTFLIRLKIRTAQMCLFFISQFKLDSAVSCPFYSSFFFFLFAFSVITLLNFLSFSFSSSSPAACLQTTSGHARNTYLLLLRYFFPR